MRPLCPKRLQPGVHTFPEGAKLWVIQIAQRANCETKLRQLWRSVAAEKTPEALRALGRIAIPIGAGDHEQMTLTCELHPRVLRDVMNRRREPARGGFLGRAFGQVFG